MTAEKSVSNSLEHLSPSGSVAFKQRLPPRQGSSEEIQNLFLRARNVRRGQRSHPPAPPRRNARSARVFRPLWRIWSFAR